MVVDVAAAVAAAVVEVVEVVVPRETNGGVDGVPPQAASAPDSTNVTRTLPTRSRYRAVMLSGQSRRSS